MKHWMIVSVETELDWPTTETVVSYLGHTLILRPPENLSAPDVRTEYDHPKEESVAFEAICRFLSAMSWYYHRPVRTRLRIPCSKPLRLGRGPIGPIECDDFVVPSDLPTPTDPKARLAIALFREALSLQNTPYEFLGYFKVINICYDKEFHQVPWINATIPLLTDHAARVRLAELQQSQTDVGRYLYKSGRCAVAHAFAEPTADPDTPEDVFRLSADMPVARALAEYLIANEFSVPRRAKG